MEKIAHCINTLAEFCGQRDIDNLSQEILYKKYKIKQADVLVLFGGSILAGGDVLAEAMHNKIAKKYIIVGGAGHTTDNLRKKMQSVLLDIDISNLSEAEIFATYLQEKYSLQVDLLETKSTNCGNNITLLLDLLTKNNIFYQNIILLQEAAMQRRMAAGIKKYRNDIEIINFAVYKIKVAVKNNELMFCDKVWGMWTMMEYISLLLGEIPRLTDNENGYGPKGKDYIAHVDIPVKVQKTFTELSKKYSLFIRKADARFANSKNSDCSNK